MGPPISFVGNEITELDKKVDGLGNKVNALDEDIKTRFQRLKEELSELEKRVEASLKSFVNEKLLIIVGILVGVMISMAGLIPNLVKNPAWGNVVIVVGIVIIAFALLLGRHSKK